MNTAGVLTKGRTGAWSSILLHIAFCELRKLFFSPIAWILLAFFCIHSATFLVDRLVSLAEGGGDSSTRYVFSDTRDGVYTQIADSLFLYVPFITMGAFSRELRSGSIKLLFSSPITTLQLVLGKYIGVMLFFVSAFLILFSFILTADLSGLSGLQYPLALTGLLGLFLLVGAYAAVGLFVSALTRYQVVAGVSAIAILFVLDLIGRVGQRVPGLSELTYWLSISAPANYMMGGLLASKDVAYFLLIILLFLGLAVENLSVGRRSGKRLARPARTVALIVIVAGLGLTTAHHRVTVYYDTHADKWMSLKPQTAELVRHIDGPWSITVLINALHPHASRHLPEHRKPVERQLFDTFRRINPHLKVDYVWYYGPAENAELFAQYPEMSLEELASRFAYKNRLNFDEFLTAEEASQFTDVATEDYRTVFLLRYQDRAAVARVFEDRAYFPLEAELSAALRRIVHGSKTIAYVKEIGGREVLRRGGPNHGFLVSDLTRRYSLVHRGFDVVETDLRDPVPADVDILVIPAPNVPLDENKARNLHDYISRGGNGVLLAEPGTADIVNPLLQPFGLALTNVEIVQSNHSVPGYVSVARINSSAPESLELNSSFSSLFDDGTVLLPSSSSFVKNAAPSDFEVAPLLQFKEGHQQLEGGEGLESTGVGSPSFVAQRDKGDRIQRWLFVADADFMSTEMNTSRETRTWPKRNVLFVRHAFGWLTNGLHPKELQIHDPPDTQVTLEVKHVNTFRITYYWILPALLLSLGMVLVARRHIA